MKNSRYTIFFIPDDSPKRYQFSISKKSILVGLGVFCVLAILFFIVVIHYAFLQDMAWENLHLRAENNKLSSELKDLSAETKKLAEALNKVEIFKNKIKLIASINDSDRNLSIGPIGDMNKENIINLPSLEDLSYLNSKTKMMRLSILRSRVELLSGEIEINQKEMEELHKYFEERKEILRSTPARWPCYGWITSEFGFRYDPFTGEKTFHRGIDIATSIGVPVIAPADGTVVSTGFNAGLGNEIVIDHGLGIVTLYGHLNDIKVRAGDRVIRGQTIGTVGNSGRTTGPHLHYEVIVNGINVNPRKYIIE
ncbi:MAG: peptidoglycan DD-metalloendopeptidase family protein [Deltaproteobacteria bacterium]|nr:peptidoglycan DD-metalloendopeptidase family protein [Deltaproteobacteria bacterium]